MVHDEARAVLSHAQSLIVKLESFAPLSGDEKTLLERLFSGQRVREIGPREDLVREGEAPDRVKLVLSGWACRYKQLADGRRQIVGFLLPGDLYDLHVHCRMDHSIGAITQVAISEAPGEALVGLTRGGSTLARSLSWAAQVTEAVTREWLVNLGQRTAAERMGHLFCELFLRQAALGLVRGNSCDLPLTQSELAECTGLSAVHVNRTLQELRAGNLIVLRRRSLTIPDLPRLQKMCLFSTTYLHQPSNPIALVRP